MKILIMGTFFLLGAINSFASPDIRCSIRSEHNEILSAVFDSSETMRSWETTIFSNPQGVSLYVMKKDDLIKFHLNVPGSGSQHGEAPRKTGIGNVEVSLSKLMSTGVATDKFSMWPDSYSLACSLITKSTIFSKNYMVSEHSFLERITGEDYFKEESIACAIDSENVKCWDTAASTDAHPVPLLKLTPPIKNPIQVAVGSDYACSLSADGVKCWSADGTLQAITTPKYKNPSYISVAGSKYYPSVCVIDSEDIRCFHDYITSNYEIKMKKPKQVSMDQNFVCALDSVGVKCWHHKTPQVLLVLPILKKPTQISLANSLFCAVDSEGVKCKDLYEEQTKIKIPEFKNPISVSVGNDHICALDKIGVKCWYKKSTTDNISNDYISDLVRPVKLSTGYKHSCAVDAEGIKCWSTGETYGSRQQQLKF